jgi:hypothetical protein
MKTVWGEITVSTRKKLRTQKKIKEKEKKHVRDRDILVVRSATGSARQGGKYICTKTS